MVALKSMIVAYGLMLLPAFVTSSPIVPHYLQGKLVSRSNISASTVEAELGSQLSLGSLVFGPDSPDFANATERWNTLFRPDVQLVVEPAAESDIAKIVKYCNDNDIEFLVRNRGHGTTSSLGTFSGIEIDVDQLLGITIQPDGETAILQAGTYGGQIIQALWDEGYVTTTGSASCVGLMGPALGGGHARYEGLYGMVQDNIIHYNVVLANGTEIGVNETSHSDLLWALKGAGHNFVIVTSVVKEIYPKLTDTWHTHTYTWTQDKLETVFEALNVFHKSANGTTPTKMGASMGSTIMNTSYSDTEAVLEWLFEYAGPADEAEELLAPFNAIGALAEDMFDQSYPEMCGVNDTTSGACEQANWAISSLLTLEYNATTERALYDNYVANVAKYPELATTAYLWHEGVYFAQVPDGSDLLDAAETWAKETWDIWNEGQPQEQPKTYVNYAEGHDYETLESIYGYDSWRLDRLRSLKAAYDPENRFRFYVPIVSE